MAHTKIISPAGWDFDRKIIIPVKMSSRGLLGQDRRAFIKVASPMFLPFLDTIKVAKDEELVHAIALGASEAYGMNRNGDGFSEDTCKKYHHTFEKFARAYRNHQNKEPAKSYGVIKKAAYNDVMRRVELLVAYNRTKEAAERNGGLVADKELEKLARGEDLAGSMACRVPFDVCSYCHHKARTRDEYCTPPLCKAGGCKDNLTRLVKVGNDVHRLGVLNPNPTWFDWSLVFRPADPTAFMNKADYFTKAASADFDGSMGVSSSKLAEDMGVTAPLAVLLADGPMPLAHDRALVEQIKLAHGLSLLEKRPSLRFSKEVKRAFDEKIQGELDLTPLGEPGTVKCAEGLVALAQNKIILALRDFARLTKKAELAPQASLHVPNVYSRMIQDGSLERRLAGNHLMALAQQAPSLALQKWANLQRGAFSLEKSAVDHRCQLSAIRGLRFQDTGILKLATADGPAEQLARDYACYQVAALQHIAAFDENFMLTARLAMGQN